MQKSGRRRAGGTVFAVELTRDNIKLFPELMQRLHEQNITQKQYELWVHEESSYIHFINERGLRVFLYVEDYLVLEPSKSTEKYTDQYHVLRKMENDEAKNRLRPVKF